MQYNLGIIPEKSSHMIRFNYFGKSDKSPNIQRSCGCTAAVWNSGNKSLTVTYNAKKLDKDRTFRQGYTNVQVTFPEEPTYKLTIGFDIRKR